MSFTDQKPQIATEADLKAPWSGGAHGKHFRCKLCGYRFQVGDYWRWVSIKGHINLMVCQKCDTPDVKEKWIEVNKKWKQMRESSPFWWFITQLEEALKDAYSPSE